MIKEKILVFGIDGAPWEYLNPLLSAGRLPNLQQLISKGVRGIAKSTLPHISSVAWSSFITGKEPRHNGIFDWCIRDGKSNRFRPVSSLDRVGKPFWNYLSERGVRVGIFNLPLTFPPRAVNGFFISGFDSPPDGARRILPSHIYTQMSAKYGDSFLFDPNKALTGTEEGQEEYTRQYIEHINKQTDVALELIEDYNIDVFVHNYMIVDHLNHRVRKYESIERGIMAVDENIGRFLKRYPNANYVIFSDHGSNRINTVFMVYNWLKRLGLVEINGKKLEMVRLHKITDYRLGTNLGMTGNTRRILRHLLLLPATLLPVATIRTLVDFMSRGLPGIIFQPHNAIDFRKSKVLYCSVGCQGFYLNIRGDNNPDGILSEREYHEVREHLAKQLLELKEPATGKRLYDRIVMKEEICSEQFQERPPDIIAHPSFPFFLCHANIVQKSDLISSSLFHDSSIIGIYGQHIDEGICIFSGPAFNCDSREILLNLRDLSAYILTLAGLAIPDDFDGGVAEKRIFSKPFMVENPVPGEFYGEFSQTAESDKVTREDEKKIQEELTKLGYM